MSPPPTPIFIISYNRLGVLRRGLASFRRLARPLEIVIHDNGSTYQPLLDYYDQLVAEGVRVLRTGKKATQQDDLNSVADTVAAYFADRAPANYVVTDPDIELDPAGADMLDLYDAILAASAEVDVVGPMLRMDDIPDSYPLKEEVVSRHWHKFWKHRTRRFPWRGGEVKLVKAVVDTTFALYRAGLPFERLRPAFRSYPPYWARHLDWYIDPTEMNEDQANYMETASGVSYWGGPLLRKMIRRQQRDGTI
ncbi:MAG: hypothetical protein KBC46_06090 [Ferrovibrio sp.]|nr:hypothetical protein [Ferrovibrio sp.]